MSSPSNVNEAVLNFLMKHADENSLRKDIEVERLQTENDKLKRDRVERLQQENISTLRSTLTTAFGRSRDSRKL